MARCRVQIILTVHIHEFSCPTVSGKDTVGFYSRMLGVRTREVHRSYSSTRQEGTELRNQNSYMEVGLFEAKREGK